MADKKQRKEGAEKQAEAQSKAKGGKKDKKAAAPEVHVKILLEFRLTSPYDLLFI